MAGITLAATHQSPTPFHARHAGAFRKMHNSIQGCGQRADFIPQILSLLTLAATGIRTLKIYFRPRFAGFSPSVNKILTTLF
jgi:hypothetical protein